MSKRLQVQIDDGSYQLFRRLAKQQQLSLGEWARRALHAYAREISSRPAHDKLKALYHAAKYEFTTADIDKMIREVAQGYQGLFKVV